MIPHKKLTLSGMWCSSSGVGVELGGIGDEVIVGEGVNVGVAVRAGNKRVSDGSGIMVVVAVGLIVCVGVAVGVSVSVEVARGREV